MAAVTIVNDTEDVNGTGADLSLAEPAGLAVGDLLVAFLASFLGAGGPDTPALISGFTNDAIIETTSGSGQDGRTCHRVADGTEGPTYASAVGAATGAAGKLVRVSGADPSDPIDGVNTATGNGTTVTLPAVVATTNGLAMAWVAASSSPLSVPSPGGWALYDDWDGGDNALFYRSVVTGESTGAPTLTQSAADSWMATVILAASVTPALRSPIRSAVRLA